MELLRQAEHNISRGLWSDEIEQAPDEDDLAHLDSDIFQFRPPKAPRVGTYDDQMPDPEEETPQLPSQQQQPYHMADLPQSIQPTQLQQQQAQATTITAPMDVQHHIQQQNIHQETSQQYQYTTTTKHAATLPNSQHILTHIPAIRKSSRLRHDSTHKQKQNPITHTDKNHITRRTKTSNTTTTTTHAKHTDDTITTTSTSHTTIGEFTTAYTTSTWHTTNTTHTKDITTKLNRSTIRSTTL
jgi:hypothetical protein